MASLNFEHEKSEFRTFYETNHKNFQAAERTFRSVVSALITQTDINIESVTSRLKDRDECIKKFARKYQAKLEAEKKEYAISEHITDIIGVRVVCYYEDEIQKVRDVLSANFEIVEVTDKIQKIESSDDLFGYKGLHLDLKINDQRRNLPEYAPFDSFRFEVQIRTIVQDAWSVLDHKIKYKKAVPTELRRRINTLAALFELADHEFLRVREEIQKNVEAKETEIDHNLGLSNNDNPTPLDSFGMTALLKNKFPELVNVGKSVDGFVEEILSQSSTITLQQVEKILDDVLPKVNLYAEFQRDNHFNLLNPYTKIRHCFYLSDKTTFALMLYDHQRENFDKWLTKND